MTLLAVVLCISGCKQPAPRSVTAPPAEVPPAAADPVVDDPVAAAAPRPAVPSAPALPVARTALPPAKRHSSQAYKQLSWLGQCNYGVGFWRHRVTSEEHARVLDGLLSAYAAVAEECERRGRRTQQCSDAQLDWMESVRAASPGIGALPDEKSVLASYCGNQPD